MNERNDISCKDKSISIWAKKHKKDIISVVAIGSVTIISVVLGVKCKDLLKDNEFLKKENVRLANKCNDLLNDTNLLKKDNMRLTDLCFVKDEYFKELMADGLRHKSSLAAKHMADRKDYLKLVG